MVYNFGTPYRNGWFGGKNPYFRKHPFGRAPTTWSLRGPPQFRLPFFSRARQEFARLLMHLDPKRFSDPKKLRLWSEKKFWKKNILENVPENPLYMEYLPTFGQFLWVNVGKYTSPIECLGWEWYIYLHGLGFACVWWCFFTDSILMGFSQPPFRRISVTFYNWVVVSNIFYVHPYLGKWSNLTNMFQMGWNRQLVILSKSRWMFDFYAIWQCSKTEHTHPKPHVFVDCWIFQCFFFPR